MPSKVAKQRLSHIENFIGSKLKERRKQLGLTQGKSPWDNKPTNSKI